MQFVTSKRPSMCHRRVIFTKFFFKYFTKFKKRSHPQILALRSRKYSWYIQRRNQGNKGLKGAGAFFNFPVQIAILHKTRRKTLTSCFLFVFSCFKNIARVQNILAFYRKTPNKIPRKHCVLLTTGVRRCQDVTFFWPSSPILLTFFSLIGRKQKASNKGRSGIWRRGKSGWKVGLSAGFWCLVASDEIQRVNMIRLFIAKTWGM